jgi:RHS repeat-associated protein
MWVYAYDARATHMTLSATYAASAASALPPRYTGKERDTESGNDYFGARYYNSATGRWLSPDWSAQAEPVPYAKLGDPQTLNLYAYVGNNPLVGIDPYGHFAGAHDFYNETNDMLMGQAEQVNKDVQKSNQAQPKSQSQNQTQPANANMNVVLSASSIVSENNGAFFVVQWDALKLDSKGAVIPHYNPKTGLYSSTPAGEIKLNEDQGAGFTTKYSRSGDVGSTTDNLIAGHPPLLQRWTVGGQPVRVVVGGTASDPKLAWTVQVTMSPRGPVYSAAP